MLESLTSLSKASQLVTKNFSIRLLRSKNLPLIISFLHREFKTQENVSMTIPYQTLLMKLTDYLEEMEYDEDEEDILAENIVLDYAEKAKLYLDRWIDANYLRNIMDDNNKVPLVLLSKHTEKVFQIFELLKEREFIGTESKFKDVLNKLKDIVENANPDKELRLLELEKRKQAIEEEIRRIQIDGFVNTYEDYQIESRYEDVNRLATELIGDFKEVEDNFKEITRQIYSRQQKQELSKGKLLAETFDAIYELKKTSQGKSFYAFWQFMMDDSSQNDFQELTREVYRVLEERGILVTNRPLRKLKALLHFAARKVLEKNALLADKLSREIVSKDHVNSKKTHELMASIRQMALKRLSVENEQRVYLEIDDKSPNIAMPLERKLGEPSYKLPFSSTATKGVVSPADLEDLSRLYSKVLIDKQALLNNIRALLSAKNSVTLKEVVGQFEITKGLPELLAYLSLLDHSHLFYINDTIREPLQFDPDNKKFLDLPQIIFTK